MHPDSDVTLSYRDLSHSRSITFPEKKSYNPHINIEYVDDKGRELTPKEVCMYVRILVGAFCDVHKHMCSGRSSIYCVCRDGPGEPPLCVYLKEIAFSLLCTRLLAS